MCKNIQRQMNFLFAVPTDKRTAGRSDRSTAAGKQHPEGCCGEMLHHQPNGVQVSPNVIPHAMAT